jgi:RNA polymerase sigma-70 factor (ECF subfamily)
MNSAGQQPSFELQPCGTAHETSSPTGPDEPTLVARLCEGDEAAYAALVERYAGAMLRFARLYLADPAAAEDAVQETWIGVLKGIGRFQRRSSIRTWLFRILFNRIRSMQRRDRHVIPFSRHFEVERAPAEPAVEADRFLPPDHPRWPMHWRVPPQTWGDSPEDRVMALETRACIDRAIAQLSPSQREVLTLHDVEGWSSDEVCNALKISASNQRVLLHRARARVRQALEDYFREA